MSYEVLLPRVEVDHLKSLPKHDATRILALLERLRENPRPPDARRIQGVDGLWMARVGLYRLAYAIDPEKHRVVIVRLSQKASAVSSESTQ